MHGPALGERSVLAGRAAAGWSAPGAPTARRSSAREIAREANARVRDCHDARRAINIRRDRLAEVAVVAP